VPKSATRNPRRSATELSGPPSLVNIESRNRSRCRSCGSERVTSIAMTLTDGSPVHFASCHQCETRWWAQDGEALTFDHVITKARKTA
jgi:hypothetical protein